MVTTTPPKRILLTGATGAIGARLLPALLERGTPPPGINDDPLDFAHAVREALAESAR